MAATGLANSAYGANGMLTWLITGTTYVKLHVGHPGSLGTSNPAAGSTTQPTVTFAAAANGAIVLSGVGPTWTNSGVAETLTHLSFWDGPTTGAHFMWSAVVGTPKTWSTNGETVTLATAGLSLAPLASD